MRTSPSLPLAPNLPAHGAHRLARRPGQSAYMLMEALVYIGIVVMLLSLGCVIVFRCIDNSVALRHTADAIAGALHTGERWRADVRAAGSQLRLENTAAEQTLYLRAAGGEVAYRFSSKAVFRRVGEGPWVRLLGNVKASAMASDRRRNVTAWRWELELQPQAKGTVKPSRLRPLFTFIAVPQS